jgi:hypothetical protein
MSNIQTVRTRLKAWLSSKIRIDVWDLDQPKKLYHPSSTPQLLVPSNSAIECPVKDLLYDRVSINGIVGSGSFTYRFVWRYSGLMTAEQLPTRKIEAVAQFVHASALLELSGCDGIQEAYPEIEEFPVMLSQADDQQSDWLLHFNLVLRVQFNLTEFDLPDEYAPIGQGDDTQVDLDELTIKTYRAIAAFNPDTTGDSTLDSTILLRQ